MAFNLLSCCWPGANKRVGDYAISHVGSRSPLLQNGSVDTPPGSKDAEGPHAGIIDHIIESIDEPSVTPQQTQTKMNVAGGDIHEREQTHEKGALEACEASPEKSTGNTAPPTGKAHASSVKAASNIATYNPIPVRTTIHAGVHGAPSQSMRPSISAGSMRGVGPRVMHGRPNTQRRIFVSGADTRPGGSRGRNQLTGMGQEGSGRFGPVEISSAAPGGARIAAMRGMPRPIPGSSGSFMSKYEMREVLGIGSTATCYRCINRITRRDFACKVIDKSAMHPKMHPLIEQFHVEVQVLQTLRHPNVIHMEDVFETEVRINMVLELMLGGELFDYVVDKGTLSEKEASVMVRKVTSAISYMHSLDIIHRDLKPENLLLTSKCKKAEIKVIDFGLAKVLRSGNERAQTFLGTRGYLAPEMLQRTSYNRAVDMWALGVIVFVLLCGCLPFDDDSTQLNFDSACKKFVLRFPRWARNLSQGAKSLLREMLTVIPEARINAQEALRHPWVTGEEAAPDKFLESPRTLRQLPRISSKGSTGGRKGNYGGDDTAETEKKSAEIIVAAANAQRRAEFEQQCGDYPEGGFKVGGGCRPRKTSF